MSYIGLIGVSRLDPENRYDFQQVEQMVKEGFDPTVIKLRTGWEQGIDGCWRYEIEDPFIPSEIIDDYVRHRYGEKINIRIILRDMQLFEAYPELEKLTLYAMYYPNKGLAGYYNPSTGSIVVSMGKPVNIDSHIEEVLLHELQHLIQDIEGFAVGGSPKKYGRRKYMRLAGEVEARNIFRRHSLSPDERRRKLRTATQDIPDNEQIVIFE